MLQITCVLLVLACYLCANGKETEEGVKTLVLVCCDTDQLIVVHIPISCNLGIVRESLRKRKF